MAIIYVFAEVLIQVQGGGDCAKNLECRFRSNQIWKVFTDYI